MKGEILDNKFRMNNYVMNVDGIGQILMTSIGSLEETLDTIDLPDRTKSTGGRTQALEFDVEVPAHHQEDVLRMELWFRENQDPVQLNAKKVATLSLIGDNGIATLSFQMIGTWVNKRATPDLARENDGEMVTLTYGMVVDRVLSTVFA